MTRTVLDEFGKRLIQEVREEAITEWKMILRGQMKGERAEELCKLIHGNEIDRASLIEAVLPMIVDSALHHFLRWLEEDEDFHISGYSQGDFIKNIAAISDGFPGELLTNAGWIARFTP